PMIYAFSPHTIPSVSLHAPHTIPSGAPLARRCDHFFRLSSFFRLTRFYPLSHVSRYRKRHEHELNLRPRESEDDDETSNRAGGRSGRGLRLLFPRKAR